MIIIIIIISISISTTAILVTNMEKQIIHQGINYIVNNVALSFSNVSGIYKFLNQPVDDVLDFTDAVRFLDVTTTSPTRRAALSVVLGYRHYVAHPGRQPPSIQDLHDAVLTLSSWYNERIGMAKILLSPMSEGELIVSLLGIAISSIIKHDLLGKAPLPIKQQPAAVPVPVQPPVVTNIGAVDDVSGDNLVADIEITGILRELRNTEWREKVKQRRIIILDGKHANKRAKFLYWSGTVAYIRFKGEKESTGVPIDRKVSILYSKYTTPQWRE